MGIAETALRLLLPKGTAWALGGHGSPLIKGTAKALERIRQAGADLVAETNPGTASATTLHEWHDTLGQAYDPTRPVATQRTRLESFRSSAGGATRAKLQAQVSLEYPALTVTEATACGEAGVCEAGVGVAGGLMTDYSPMYYNVTGTVEAETDAQRVGAILNRFAPLHLFALLLITVRTLTTISEAGLGVAGLAEAGSDGTPLA